MYYGQVNRKIIGYCIYCGSVVYEDEEGEIIFTGSRECRCALPEEEEEVPPAKTDGL